MNWNPDPYSLALFASAITALMIAILTWRRRTAPGALPLFIMLVTTILWAGANGLLLTAVTPQGRLFWFNILSVGALCGTPAFLAFALQYTGREHWLTPRNSLLICVIPVVSVLLTWTNNSHHLFYQEIDFTASLPTGGWKATPGIGYQVFLAYSYPLVFYSIGIIAQAFFRSPRLYRGQTGAILIGTLIPLAGNIIYNVVTGGSAKGWADPTPILFTVMGILYAYGLFAFRLFDIVPVARHTLVEHMADGVLVVDSRNRIVDINPAALRLLGLSHRPPMGLYLDQLTTSLPDSVTHPLHASNLQTEITTNGDPAYHFDLRVETMFDQQKQANGRLIVLRDITEKKQADNALRSSEMQVRGLLDAIPDSIFELRSDGVVLQYASSDEAFAGKSSGESLGKPVDLIFPEAVASQIMFAVERSLESELLHVFEFQLPQAGNDRSYEARVAVSGENTVRMIVRDVSLHKRLQTERENLINELDAKNSELERFTNAVSHDLKSPLITIYGFLDLLKEDVAAENASRVQTDIVRINHAMEIMQQRLNDLLELSRAGRLTDKPEVIQFNNLIAEALELVHGRISQRGIAVHVEENLPSIIGNHHRLLEVLQNLIDNAAKFMGDQPNPLVEIGQHGEYNGKPIFFVKDNGMGISAEHHERIFDIFKKLNPKAEGTGVGLSLVKKIIEVHEGRIWLESEVGKGTIFYFTLPTK